MSIAPDIFQERISELFFDMEQVRAFMDDLLVVSHGTYEGHIKDSGVTLTRLQDRG